MANLYDVIEARGIPHDSHESDLYLPDTPEVRGLLAEFPTDHANARRFVSERDGGTWWDVPFAFMPWWRRRFGHA